MWSDDFRNSTMWSTSGGVTESLHVAGSLTLSVAFPISAVPQSASVSRRVVLSLDPDPVLTMTVIVSQGVSYGVRFFGTTPNNVSFVAWHEGSSLQHRLGLGGPETITANLSVESFLADQKLSPSGSKITQLLFYLEIPAREGGTFSLAILSLTARSLQHTRLDSKEASGNFRGLIVDIGYPQLIDNPFQIFMGFDIKGTSDLTYAPEFVRGMLITAQGYTYVPKSITTYELAVLNPAIVPTPSPFRAGTNSSSASLFVVVLGGGITYFRIDSISLRTTSQSPIFGASTEPSNAQSLLIYYFFFLFIIPVALVILLTMAFRREE